MSNIIPFHARLDIRLPPRRRSRKHRAQIIKFPNPLDRESSEALFNRADAIDESEPAKAAPIYEHIIARHDRWEALSVINLGNCWFRTHQADKAQVAYTRALELDPKQPSAHYNLGYLLLEQGDAESALVSLRLATKYDPSFADAWFNQAIAAEQAGIPLEAQACFARYVRLEPKGEWSDRARQRLA